MVLEERFGFLEVVAAVVNRQLGSGVDFADEALADLAGLFVNNSHREILDAFVVVEAAKKKRVYDWGNEENEQDGAVAEDAAHLDAEHQPYIS